MKKFFIISFYAIILISLLIAFLNGITFNLYVKRSIIYFILIIFGMIVLEKTVSPILNKCVETVDDQSKGQPTQEDEFRPLEFKTSERVMDTSNFGIKKEP